MGQQVGSALAESMHRVLVKLVSFLPGLLALLIRVTLPKMMRQSGDQATS